MPAKYSHVKKRNAAGLHKKNTSQTQQNEGKDHGHGHGQSRRHHRLNPFIDKTISHALNTLTQLEPAIADLERSIARLLLIRYEQDIARLFSTRLYSISLVQIPTLIMRCLSLGGPGWIAWNYDCDEIKDFFRSVISVDMRQAGERVATKSVLWSYTALRQFALSCNVPVCSKRGLHSLRLLPYYPSLKSHLEELESRPPSTFTKPTHLGTLQEGQDAIQDACELKYGRLKGMPAHPEWSDESIWKQKVRYGYDMLNKTLWNVAREFDVRGYGLVLREKLTTKWCECGCSTDHLGEVCERTVREEEEESGVRIGKRREWDGRGSGVLGWDTEEEEDIWEVDLDFGSDPQQKLESETIGEIMEWRYLRAEKEKEEGNTAFRKGDFETAVKHYELAHNIEPEMPVYQLNLAAAHLKLNNWIEAEKACTKALGQHRSSKGFYRRARAKRMLGKHQEAIKDLRAVLRLQPTSTEAINELLTLIPEAQPPPDPSIPSSSSQPFPSSSSSTTIKPNKSLQTRQIDYELLERLGVYKTSSLSSSSSGSASGDSGSGSGSGPTSEPKAPFEKKYQDSRKLKIIQLPPYNSTIPIKSEDLKGIECEHGIGCLHYREKEKAGDRIRNLKILNHDNRIQEGNPNANGNESAKTKKANIEVNNAEWTASASANIKENLGEYANTGIGAGERGGSRIGNISEKKKRKNEKIREIEYLRTIVNCPTWDNYLVKVVHGG